MVTWVKAGICKPKFYSAVVQPSYPLVEPTSIKATLLCPECKHAMDDELKVLMANQTRVFVLPHPQQRLVGHKWIF